MPGIRSKFRGTISTELKSGFYMICMAWKFKAAYLLNIVLYILIKTISPFILVLFPGYIIDLIISGAGMKRVFLWIVFMGAVYFLLNALQKVLENVKNIQDEQFKMYLNICLSRKCMNLKYDDLENKKVLEQIDKARMAVSGGLSYTQSLGLSGEQGIGGYFNQIADLPAYILRICGFLYILRVIKWWVLLVIIISIIVSVKFNNIKRRVDVDVRQETAPYLRKNQYCNRVLRSLEYGKEIRMYDLDDFLLNKFSECNRNYIKIRNGYRNKACGISCLSQLVSNCVNVSVYVSLLIMLAQDMISVGSFTQTASAAIGLFDSSVGLARVFINMDIFAEYMNDYRNIMSREEEHSDGIGITGDSHVIEFRNVWFKYAGHDKYALEDVSLKIESGKKFSVVGANGAGKTTFIKLLLGLYEPEKGRILFDGRPIEQYSLEEYRKYACAIFQDFRIYSMDINDNVSMQEYSDLDKIWCSLRKGGMETKVKSFPQETKTMLNGFFKKKSVCLSGGESQKLAMSRLFYRESPLMIFDEPTSALDPLAESEIYDRLQPQLQDKTVIFISHRLASSRFCDEIIVFDKGKIAERGTHEQLIELGKLYYTMWNAQSEYYNNKL